MKLRNFNLEDVFGANDLEQAKAYIGKKGYYADCIEDLDDYIENKSHIDKLYAVDEDLGIFRYVIGRSYDYNNNYNYFLPLEKVKKTEPAEKEAKYRPFKTLDEFYDFTGAHSYLREIYIVFRNKKTHCVYDESIFSISYNEKDELLTINRFSVQELFDNFEFYSFGKWVPFGVEVKDE